MRVDRYQQGSRHCFDLRFAVGDVAIGAGRGEFVHVEKDRAGSLVVLVNGDTRGAAETLAWLAPRRTGLIIGSPTAGEAATFKEFPLRNGERLRIATPPVKSGEARHFLRPTCGRDIAVTVNADAERVFWENPY